MKFLIDIELDGYDKISEMEEACVEAVENGLSDHCHASVTVLWKEDISGSVI